MRVTTEDRSARDGVDFDKVQLLQAINNVDVLVLTTGVHDKSTFCGVRIPSGRGPFVEGSYSAVWTKSVFKVFEGSLTLEQ